MHFFDERMLVPELLPREFVGRNLFPDDEGGKSFLYFREPTASAIGSHEVALGEGNAQEDDLTAEASLDCEEEVEESGVVHFEDALSQLIECSLRRKKAGGSGT